MSRTHRLTDATVSETILRLVAERAAGKSICPSEVARALAASGEAWQQHMTHIRSVAAGLSRAGQVTILRHNKPIAPEAMRGVIRLTHGSGLARPAAQPDTFETSQDEPSDDQES